MRKQILLVLTCSLSSALFAQAQTPAAAPAAPAEEKLSCRYYRQTGSIMPGKRICHTKAEWRIIDAQMSEEARRALGRDRGMSSGSASN